jgi:hypothetical protein
MAAPIFDDVEYQASIFADTRAIISGGALVFADFRVPGTIEIEHIEARIVSAGRANDGRMENPDEVGIPDGGRSRT